MSSEPEGGLSATEEHHEETPPHEDDGQDHEAGAAQKDKPEPASSGDDPDEDVPKGVRKRIQRAVRDRDVEVGRRAAAEAEAEQLRERLQKYEPDADSKRPEPGQQRRDPVPDVRAEERQNRLRDFSEDGEDKYDDFIDVVHENRRLRVTNAMADAMLEAENGIDIAYHLGKNPKEARRIAGLSEVAQAKEIGKLEVQLTAEAKKPAVKVSKTPSPIEPLNGGKSHPKGLRADSSMDDFIKATR